RLHRWFFRRHSWHLNPGATATDPGRPEARSRGGEGTKFSQKVKVGASKQSCYPAWLPHMFLFQTSQTRSHNARPAQITNYAAWIVAVHHGKTSNIVAQHLGRCFV